MGKKMQHECTTCKCNGDSIFGVVYVISDITGKYLTTLLGDEAFAG